MLTWTGWGFRVSPANIDEGRLPGEPADRYVLRLASGKANTMLPQARPGELVLAADTIVVDGDELLGKPQNPAAAAGMLRQLRGRTHQVYTALAVIAPQDGETRLDLCVSQVPMRGYSDAEIETYVQSGDPLDKAGGYAIQNVAFHPVTGFQGCFASVMGLPLCHLVRSVGKIGVKPPVDVPQTCQAHLDYACPIFQAVLRGETVG